eukprot:CAMPEP_0113696692 /NCGR_PEP_ID=MMETSP0038_2-20120614/21661_1 /TAXON_ID=2898 /ORGANISM="Cryptomonas paramecium" /LENGTH=354 /DNA_ID=CAMNT_0000619503 /DNA_START=91 /DNA_END=1155 /DNA_ORIENTATION=+ /assembly_acc=CAM_ASM_000170
MSTISDTGAIVGIVVAVVSVSVCCIGAMLCIDRQRRGRSSAQHLGQSFQHQFTVSAPQIAAPQNTQIQGRLPPSIAPDDAIRAKGTAADHAQLPSHLLEACSRINQGVLPPARVLPFSQFTREDKSCASGSFKTVWKARWAASPGDAAHDVALLLVRGDGAALLNQELKVYMRVGPHPAILAVVGLSCADLGGGVSPLLAVEWAALGPLDQYLAEHRHRLPRSGPWRAAPCKGVAGLLCALRIDTSLHCGFAFSTRLEVGGRAPTSSRSRGRCSRQSAHTSSFNRQAQQLQIGDWDKRGENGSQSACSMAPRTTARLRVQGARIHLALYTSYTSPFTPRTPRPLHCVHLARGFH